MRLYAVVIGVLVVCTMSLATENGPLFTVLQPVDEASLEEPSVHAEPPNAAAYQATRPKRTLLLGAGAIALGAGVIGAKAGFLGGAALGSALGHGRSYGGGWGYGGGYGSGYYGGGYGGGYYGGGYYGGGYGRGYRSYYPTTYVVSDPWC